MGKVMMSARQKIEAGLVKARPNQVMVRIEMLTALVRAVEKYGNKQLKGMNAFQDALEAVRTAEEGGCPDCGRE